MLSDEYFHQFNLRRSEKNKYKKETLLLMTIENINKRTFVKEIKVLLPYWEVVFTWRYRRARRNKTPAAIWFSFSFLIFFFSLFVMKLSRVTTRLAILLHNYIEFKKLDKIIHIINCVEMVLSSSIYTPRALIFYYY